MRQYNYPFVMLEELKELINYWMKAENPMILIEQVSERFIG